MGNVYEFAITKDNKAVPDEGDPNVRRRSGEPGFIVHRAENWGIANALADKNVPGDMIGELFCQMCGEFQGKRDCNCMASSTPVVKGFDRLS